MATRPLQSSLIGSKLYYEKSSQHASYNFGQKALSLFRNQPRFPFEYYININLNNIDTAKTFISDFFNTADLAQIMPLVKTVDMPSMKIDTTPLNQYNRKRLSQTKIAYEPIKMVFHDVADGKTLKFWDMYYRYYFSDGNEPGKNVAKSFPNPNREDLGAQSDLSTNTNGDKSSIQNIVADALDNHNFGFNLPTVQNIRNLIQTIEIYQVHGGRFNQVTLVNPRISAFTHDMLNYSTGDKTLEITLMWEYEYAYYTIQNMQLTDPDKNTGGQTNNSSSIEPFIHGEFLELSNLSFTQWDPALIESNNPILTSDNPAFVTPSNNVQSGLDSVTTQYTSDYSSVRTSSSSLDGLIDMSPQRVNTASSPIIATRPFASDAQPDTTMYPDMFREGGTTI